MTQNKTLSTRVSTEIYKLFTEQCDEDSISVSQCLKQMITDLSLGRKEYEDSSQCSIEKDTEKTAKFEQDSAMKKLLEELQDKNIRIKNEQVQNIKLQGWLDEIKDDIENLKTSFNKKLEEDRMKKGMECFVDDSCFPTS